MKKKMLLLENDLRIRNLLKLALRAEGYQVLTVSDSYQALRQIWSDRPGLLIVDVTMPGLHGVVNLVPCAQYRTLVTGGDQQPGFLGSTRRLFALQETPETKLCSFRRRETWFLPKCLVVNPRVLRSRQHPFIDGPELGLSRGCSLFVPSCAKNTPALRSQTAADNYTRLSGS